MQELLNTGIKDIIARSPETGKLLEEYDIGCTTCQLGSCMLKDIVSIHNLPPERERELFTRMGAILFPGREVILPASTAKQTAPARNGSYSPPVRRMVEEHTFIKKLLGLIPQRIIATDITTTDGKALIERMLYFIRNYADRYHHAKEEDILFGYVDRSSDIISVMLSDHVNGRNHVKGIAEALQRGDKDAVVNGFIAYRDLLTEHIRKEDDILYPWIDRQLSTHQVGELFSRCAAVDTDFTAVREECESFVNALSA